MNQNNENATIKSLEVIGESGIEEQLNSRRLGEGVSPTHSGFKQDTTTTATKQNAFG